MPVAYSLYVPGESWLYKIDPRAKFIWLICGFLFTITFNNPFYLITILFATLVIGATAGLNASTIRLVIGSSAFFAVFSIVLWPFYFHQGPVLFTVFNNNITVDGLLYGFAAGIRMGAMIAIATVWITTTSPQQITVALMKWGLPSQAATGITLAIRFIPMISGEITTILEAQRSRGLDFNKGNLIVKLKKYIPVIVPVLMRAFIIAQQLGLALEAKGFGSGENFTIVDDLEMKYKDYQYAFIWLIILIVSVYLRHLGFGVIAKDLL